MCNFDSMGSALGWAEFTVNANDDLRKMIKKYFNSNDIYYVETTAACPYTDQFPFAACGVPGIWQLRKNCENGIYYHHRFDNTPDKLDFELCANYVKASSELLTFLAETDDIENYRTIPQEQQDKINQLFDAVYGGF